MPIASTLYDVLRPAALFDELGNKRKELALVLAPDVDARTQRWLLGVLAKSSEGPEVFELGLEGKSDVSIHFSWPLFGARSWRYLCDILCVRLRCKSCVSKWAHRGSTYGHFISDLVRDQHYEEWSSRRSLVRN